MKCNELVTRLKDLGQMQSSVFMDPADGKGGLYEICGARLASNGGSLPTVILSSAGLSDPPGPMTAEALGQVLRRVPELSQVFYDDPSMGLLIDLVTVGLIHRADLDRRGFRDTPAPAVILSS